MIGCLFPKEEYLIEGKEGKGSRFPSALIGIRVPPPKGLDGFTLTLKVHGLSN